MKQSQIETTTLYDTETCWRHAREYPGWLMRCPDCEQEEQKKRQAAHFSQKRREGYSASYVDADEPDLTREEVVNWNRWTAQAVTTVLLLVLLFGLWIAAQNRATDRNLSVTAGETQR